MSSETVWEAEKLGSCMIEGRNWSNIICIKEEEKYDTGNERETGRRKRMMMAMNMYKKQSKGKWRISQRAIKSACLQLLIRLEIGKKWLSRVVLIGQRMEREWIYKTEPIPSSRMRVQREWWWAEPTHLFSLFCPLTSWTSLTITRVISPSFPTFLCYSFCMNYCCCCTLRSSSQLFRILFVYSLRTLSELFSVHFILFQRELLFFSRQVQCAIHNRTFQVDDHKKWLAPINSLIIFFSYHSSLHRTTDFNIEWK